MRSSINAQASSPELNELTVYQTINKSHASVCFPAAEGLVLVYTPSLSVQLMALELHRANPNK
jgi:hypothetical protein